MIRPRRSSVLGLLGLAAAAAVSLPILAFSAPAGTQAPDLRADPVEDIEGPQVYADTGPYGAGKLLVRFEGYVTNIGQGPLEVSGNPQNGTVRQRAWTATQGPGDLPTEVVGTPLVVYEEADGHDHFHLKSAMRYSLWNLQRTAQVAPGQKAGFCLYDIEDAPNPAPSQDPQEYTEDVTNFCEQGQPGSTALRMGTSAGWRDVYGKYLAYQWVDVSNTAPGVYLVGSEADPENQIWEGGGANEVNPAAFASQQVTVPGWTAQPVSVPQTGQPREVALLSAKYGTASDGNLRYRVVTAPANGSLSVPVGVSFNPATTKLTYTPSPGFAGSDSFSFTALSAASSFPVSPPVSTVTLVGATPSVTISGSPGTLVANASVQLSASLANLPGGVTWSASAGSINSSGLYTAPSSPPPGGTAIITATSSANSSVAAQVGIVITPTPPPAAKPGVAGALSAGNKLVSRLALGRVGKRVVIGKIATGPKAGRIVFTATFGPKVVGRCVIKKVGARKTVTCKMTLKKVYPLRKVRVSAKFTAANGGKTAVRRAFVLR